MTLSIHQQRLQNDRLLLEVNASNANARKHLFNLCDRLRSDLSTKPKIHISQNFEYSSININGAFLCGWRDNLVYFFSIHQIHYENPLGKMDLRFLSFQHLFFRFFEDPPNYLVHLNYLNFRAKIILPFYYRVSQQVLDDNF